MQVARVQCKFGICTSGWKEEHHQRKLQWVKPPRVQVESLCQQLRERHHHHKLLPVTTTASTRCKGQGARCKGQEWHQCKSEWDAATTCNSNHHHSGNLHCVVIRMKISRVLQHVHLPKWHLKVEAHKIIIALLL